MGQLFFGQSITAENYLNVLTQFVALLERKNESECWFQQHGMPAHMAKTTALSQDFHDHIYGHELWLLLSPDYFLWGFLNKESTAIIQESWRTLNTTMNWLLLALTNKLSKKLQKAVSKEQMLVFTKGRGIFSICCSYTLFVTFLGHSKKLKFKQYIKQYK